jgi:hypothetical protein
MCSIFVLKSSKSRSHLNAYPVIVIDFIERYRYLAMSVTFFLTPLIYYYNNPLSS